MSEKNSGIFILAILLVLGLFSLAGAVAWLAMQQRASRLASSPGNNNSSSSTQSATIPNSFNDVALQSESNVDYSKLREDLQGKDWKAADRETYLRLLDAAGSLARERGMIPQSEMNTLSCVDLKTVDRLWSAATKGEQGFTVQMNIFRALGFDYRKMYDAVGWQKLPPSNAWTFEWRYNAGERRLEFVPGKEPNYTNPPPGHLPTVEIGYNVDAAFSGALKRCGF